MTDHKILAERIRQTLAEGGNCELTTEECRAVADLLERREKPKTTNDYRTDKLIEEINIIGSTGWLDIRTEEMINIIHKYTDNESEEIDGRN